MPLPIPSNTLWVLLATTTERGAVRQIRLSAGVEDALVGFLSGVEHGAGVAAGFVRVSAQRCFSVCAADVGVRGTGGET